MLPPAASTAVPITAHDQQNKFPTKNSLKAFLTNPSYPSGQHHEEKDGKTQGKPSGLEMCYPFPVIQPPTVLPKLSPLSHMVSLPPAALLFTQNPSSNSAPQRQQGCCWKSHSFTCGLCSSITAKPTTSPGNEVGQLSTTLLLWLC